MNHNTKRVANRSPSFLRFVEVLWKSGLHEAQKRPRIGSPKIGSLREVIIAHTEAAANRKRGKFAEWLRLTRIFTCNFAMLKINLIINLKMIKLNLTNDKNDDILYDR